jgi:hypothetical protein
MSIGLLSSSDGSSLTVTVPATPGALYIAQVMIQGNNHLSGSALSKFIPIKPASWTNLTGNFQIEEGDRTWQAGFGWDMACWISDGLTTSHTWTLDPAVGGAHQILTNVVGLRKASGKFWHIEPQQGSLSGIGNGFSESDAFPFLVGGAYTRDINVKTNYGNINRGFQAEWVMCFGGSLYGQAGGTISPLLTQSDTSPLRFHELHKKTDMRMTSYWDGIPNGPGHAGVYANDLDYVVCHSYSVVQKEGVSASTWDGSKAHLTGVIQPYVALDGDTNHYGFDSTIGATVITSRADYTHGFPGNMVATPLAEGWHLFE